MDKMKLERMHFPFRGAKVAINIGNRTFAFELFVSGSIF